MKISITFKTPDALWELDKMKCLSEDCDGDCEVCNLKAFVKSKVEYGEYIYVGFDGEAKTCTIL